MILIDPRLSGRFRWSYLPSRVQHQPDTFLRCCWSFVQLNHMAASLGGLIGAGACIHAFLGMDAGDLANEAAQGSSMYCAPY